MRGFEPAPTRHPAGPSAVVADASALGDRESPAAAARAGVEGRLARVAPAAEADGRHARERRLCRSKPPRLIRSHQPARGTLHADASGACAARARAGADSASSRLARTGIAL